MSTTRSRSPASATCPPPTRPITIRFGRSGPGPSSSITRDSTHSSWAGLSATRGGRTTAEGALVSPARGEPSSPGAGERVVAVRGADRAGVHGLAQAPGRQVDDELAGRDDAALWSKLTNPA